MARIVRLNYEIYFVMERCSESTAINCDGEGRL